jgi:K+-sensing histidine kinase KdpD
VSAAPVPSWPSGVEEDRPETWPPPNGGWAYALAAVTVAVCTAVAWAISPYFRPANLVMVFLAGTVALATRVGRGPSIIGATLSVLVFDAVFTPPPFMISLRDTEYVVGLVVMVALAAFISDRSEHIRRQARLAHALARERQALSEEAHEAKIRFETERLRNALLSAVSHDLRTPLAAIKGAATSLIEGGDSFALGTRLELSEAIRDEADRLTRLVNNLLDMTRLEAGWKIRRDWHALEELVGVALATVEPRLGDRKVTTDLPLDLPLIPVDGLLIQQVLVNLLENAAKHTRPGTPIEISAAVSDGSVTVSVADRGAGLTDDEMPHVFEKFYRAPGVSADGLGLGLAICTGIVDAHGGRLWAENRAGGGAVFRFALPITAPPPVS